MSRKQRQKHEFHIDLISDAEKGRMDSHYNQSCSKQPYDIFAASF